MRSCDNIMLIHLPDVFPFLESIRLKQFKFLGRQVILPDIRSYGRERRAQFC